jgi:endonuclease/exonuclease/phosphatase (EEP) superfamily protein YafD
MMKRVLSLAAWAAVLALLLGFLGPWFQLGDSFAQFRHVLVIAVAIVAVVSAIRQSWTRAMMATASVVAGIALSYPHLPFGGPDADGQGKYKLIQFNLKLHNARQAEAAQWVLAQRPDVVMLQEYLPETHPAFAALEAELPYGTTCKSVKLGYVAVRTRFPIMSQHCVESEGLTWLQANVDGKPITFAALHLHWPWPFRQWQQLESLQSAFAAMPQPVVLAGDFNAAPWSASVKTVETWTKSDVIPGYRATLWPDVFHNEKTWPALPIDQVLLPAGSVVSQVHVGPFLGSDHRPVVVGFDPWSEPDFNN